MTATKTQLTGGVFQDSAGNVLALGYLKMVLNQDNSVSGVCNVAAGIEITIQLNSSGSVSTSPAQYIWATDVLTLPNSYYTVTGYTASGQPAWGPNNQQVTSGGTGGGTFDTGLWVPNSVFSWTPPIQPLTLKTNGVLNGSQILFNLVGSGVTITDNGSGTVTISAASGIVLKTNGVDNGSQVLLNLKQSTGITVVDDGVGGVTITNTAPYTGATPQVGSNVIQTPAAPAGGASDQSSFPYHSTWSNWNPGGVGPTFFQFIPSTSILVPCSTWTITIYQGTATANLSFKAQILKCALGQNTVLAVANVTFGGQATPTFTSAAGTFHTSDTIAFPIDVQGFDYYFVVNSITNQPYIGATASGQVGATGNIWISPIDQYGLTVSSSINFAGGGTEPDSWIVNWNVVS